jgi:DNA-binding MarR family transcriptional regulator
MHPVLNEMKRAYWRSHAMLAPLARRHGLTPSRFDMLLSIAQSPGRIILNKDLVEIVGATPGVVARMVRALEELGLVVCDRSARKKRSFFVGVTAQGIERVEAMIAELDVGGVELAIETVVSEDWWAPESRERDPAELVTRLRRVRWRRGDHGRIVYEAPIAPELADPRAPHRTKPWADVMRRIQQRMDRRNFMARRRRIRRGIEAAKRLVLPGLQAPDPRPPELIPTIPYRGKDSILFRISHRDPIPWEVEPGPFDPNDPLFQEEEIPDDALPEWPDDPR